MDSEQRYEILSEPCVFRRYDKLDHYLNTTRKTLAIAEQMGPSLSETGLPLN